MNILLPRNIFPQEEYRWTKVRYERQELKFKELSCDLPAPSAPAPNAENAYVFLDCDGVLNACTGAIATLQQVSSFNLNHFRMLLRQLADWTLSPRVIVSSSWKNDARMRAELTRALASINCEVYAWTPYVPRTGETEDDHTHQREKEILAAIKEYCVPSNVRRLHPSRAWTADQGCLCIALDDLPLAPTLKDVDGRVLCVCLRTERDVGLTASDLKRITYDGFGFRVTPRMRVGPAPASARAPVPEPARWHVTHAPGAVPDPSAARSPYVLWQQFAPARSLGVWHVMDAARLSMFQKLQHCVPGSLFALADDEGEHPMYLAEAFLDAHTHMTFEAWHLGTQMDRDLLRKTRFAVVSSFDMLQNEMKALKEAVLTARAAETVTGPPEALTDREPLIPDQPKGAARLSIDPLATAGSTPMLVVETPGPGTEYTKVNPKEEDAEEAVQPLMEPTAEVYRDKDDGAQTAISPDCVPDLHAPPAAQMEQGDAPQGLELREGEEALKGEVETPVPSIKDVSMAKVLEELNGKKHPEVWQKVQGEKAKKNFMYKREADGHEAGEQAAGEHEARGRDAGEREARSRSRSRSPSRSRSRSSAHPRANKKHVRVYRESDKISGDAYKAALLQYILDNTSLGTSKQWVDWEEVIKRGSKDLSEEAVEKMQKWADALMQEALQSFPTR